MAIVSPEQLRFSGKNIVMVLYALPGVGKTTLALSAPDPVIFDFDQGLVRVWREHLKPAEISTDYSVVLDTLRGLSPKQFKTVILDTTGNMIESMKAWAMKTDTNATTKGGKISQAGYGIVKSEFLRLSAELRAKFNVIFVFHADKTKGTELQWYYDLICEGSAKVVVWQPADLGAYMFIDNGKRFLGFSPTGEYSAKSGHGVKGIYEVPELQHGDPNVFLTGLFDRVRNNIAAEDEQGSNEREKYIEIMKEGQAIINAVNGVSDIAPQVAKMKALGSAMTSANELRGRMSARLKELRISWNKELGKYVQEPLPEPEQTLMPQQDPAPAPEPAEDDVPGGGLL